MNAQGWATNGTANPIWTLRISKPGVISHDLACCGIETQPAPGKHLSVDPSNLRACPDGLLVCEVRFLL